MADALHIPNERPASDAAHIARASHRIGNRGGKGAVAVVQINIQIGAGVVAHHQITPSIAIQVPDTNGEAGCSRTVGDRRLEGAVAVAHQYLQLAGGAIRAHRQVQLAIAVEVGRYQMLRPEHRIERWALEAPIAIT